MVKYHVYFFTGIILKSVVLCHLYNDRLDTPQPVLSLERKEEWNNEIFKGIENENPSDIRDFWCSPLSTYEDFEMSSPNISSPIYQSSESNHVQIDEVLSNIHTADDFFKIFEEKRLLGRGSFSHVLLMEYKNIEVAVKISDFSFIKNKRALFSGKASIYKLLKTHPHKNISKVYKVFDEKFPVLYTVMEVINGVQLYNFLEKSGFNSELNDIKSSFNSFFLVTEIIYQLLRALKHLRKIKVVHGDLFNRNILIDDDNQVKLIGFGLSKVVLDNTPFIFKDKKLMLKNPGLTVKKDILECTNDFFVLGFLILGICNKQLIDFEQEYRSFVSNTLYIHKNRMIIPMSNKRILDFKDNFFTTAPELSEILKGLLEFDYTKRIGYEISSINSVLNEIIPRLRRRVCWLDNDWRQISKFPSIEDSFNKS